MGQSFHNTSHDGASFELDFYGTAVYLFGSANCSYSVSVDGYIPVLTTPITINPTDNLLFTTADLQPSNHSLKLTVNVSGASQQLSLDSIMITIPSMDGSSSQPEPSFFDNSNTSAILYNGNWTIGQGSGIPNNTAEVPFHQTTQHGSSFAFTFRGGDAVAIYGVANFGHGSYIIDVDGNQIERNGSTYFQVPNSLLYFQAGLDSTKPHTVNATSSDVEGVKLSLNSIDLYGNNILVTSSQSSSPNPSPSSFPSSRKTSDGLIAGVTVAALVVALSAILGSLFLWTRRSRRQRQQQELLTARPLYYRPRTEQDTLPGPGPDKVASQGLGSSTPRERSAISPSSPALSTSASDRNVAASPISSGISNHRLTSEGTSYGAPYPSVEALVQMIADRIDPRRNGDNVYLGSDARPPDYDTVEGAQWD